MTKVLFIFGFVLLFLNSCRKDEVFINEEFTIVHIAHTRTDELNEIDSLVSTVDFSNVDVLCLGGDLLFNSSADTANLNLLDNLFDLGSPSTLWSMGNHDVSNVELLKSYTHRELYHAFYFKGITFIVLNTQESGSSIEGDQLNFFNSVVDTVSISSHCIVIHHKLIWMDNNPDLMPIANDISNGPLGTCDYCIAPNNFYEDLYPKLVQLQQNNVNVTLIGGDIGNHTNEFHYETAENISFYASGMKSSINNQQYLELRYSLISGYLNFAYKDLSFLN